MSLKFIKEIDFSKALIIAYNIQKSYEHVAFLHSVKTNSYSGNKSFLAFGASEICADFAALESKLSEDADFFDNLWFGYISYENLRHNYPNINIDLPSYIETKESFFFKAANLIIFDFVAQNAKFYSDSNSDFIEDDFNNNILSPSFLIKNLRANYSKNDYFRKISDIKNLIKEGDFYQLNLTRKIMGEIDNYCAFSIFNDLINISPTPYSAFFKLSDLYVISSSPERFVTIDSKGEINVRPIKGTISSKASNSIDNLKDSEKNQAENLMIVDLMRNDLTMVSNANSVKTDSLFDLDSYEYLHHLSSSISSSKKSSSHFVVKNIFPPGSMTGAPKKIVIENIARLEAMKRGIYSGSVGFFAGNGEADFSVVIRTIIIHKNKFEFQAGGAITYDSDSFDEWKEISVKSKAICKSLNLDISMIENL